MTTFPEKALDADIAILGRKGRGKTFAAKGIVERLLERGSRVVILDPVSVWWGLRSSRDGKKPGFPVAIFGGEHQDMPLTPAMAEPLADIIARENLPCVIDYGALSRAEIQRFATAFLERLYRKNRTPLTLVLEEADMLAPQNPMGDQAMTFSVVDKIARRGRAFGFRLISITQRPARLHKDVLSQASTLVALGVSSPQDRDAIRAWVEGNGDREQAREVFDSLAKLQRGQGWVWAPDLDVLNLVKFPEIRTLDTSATPADGEKRPAPTSLARVDLSAIREALQEEVQEPPKGSKAGRTDQDIEAARLAGYREGHNAGFQKGHAAGCVDAMRRAIEALESLPAVKGAPARNETEVEPALNDSPDRRTRISAAVSGSGADALVDAARAVWPARLTWSALCATIGRKAAGGHFNRSRKEALDSGRLVEQGGLVVLSDPPSSAGGAVAADLLEDRLPGGARELFCAIRRSPGLTWQDYATRLGRQATGGHWNRSRSILRTSQLVEEAGERVRVARNLEKAA